MFRFLKGHVLDQLTALPSDSVHCVVTSPPYWGLRRYGDWRMQVEWRECPKTIRAWHPPKDQRKSKHHLIFLKIRADRKGIVWAPGNVAYICALGLEPTPDMFIEHMVRIFREVRRVLRPDGVCFLNLGDSYITKLNGSGSAFDPKNPKARCRRDGLIANRTNNPGEFGLKHKDLLLMPHRVALALQKDGWYVRMDIVWDKANPMPESVTDRPTRSHEYVFLLTKSDQYFYDAEAIKEQVSGGAHARGDGLNPKAKANGPNSGMLKSNAAGRDNFKPNPSRHNVRPKQNASFSTAVNELVALRNKRSVWRIASEPFKGKHYATFPKKLVEPCILAGTSARGCCPYCGAPWVRVTEKASLKNEVYNGKYANEDNRGRNLQRAIKAGLKAGGDHDNPFPQAKTVGWRPNCECNGRLVRAKIVIPARMSKDAAQAWGADSNGEYHGQNQKDYAAAKAQKPSTVKARIIKNATEDREVTGIVYRSDLPLEKHPVVPCTVLDPFLGSGTTAAVALDLGRRVIGIDLWEGNEVLIKERTNITPGLRLA